MPPRMTTQSAGRPAAASQGRRMGGRAGRGGGRTEGRYGDQGNGRIDGQGSQVGGQAQVGDQGRGQGNVYTHWIEKMDLVQNMSGCGDNHKVKYTADSFFGKALTWWNSHIRILGREVVVADHAAYTDRFHELARLVPHLVTPENKRIERNGSIKKNPKKRGNGGEPSKDRNGRDDNNRTMTENAFATTTNLVRREYMGTTPNMSKVKSGSKARGNHQNQVVAVNGGQGRGNNGNQARGRAFMLGAEEACQDPNIITDTFTLNNHYAITLFDYGADYSFVSTTFIPLLGIEPNNLGFSYEIMIASGQLVEIDKVIKGCKLEIEGHVFDINLIPFGSGSFNMII
ncbi:putative reverse transcriptase domain-containing protein [Tanacetum coccineum]